MKLTNDGSLWVLPLSTIYITWHDNTNFHNFKRQKTNNLGLRHVSIYRRIISRHFSTTRGLVNWPIIAPQCKMPCLLWGWIFFLVFSWIFKSWFWNDLDFPQYSCRYRAPQILQLENLEDLINEGKKNLVKI